MSKVFTVLNLLTFDGVKYMENGDLCSVVQWCMDRLHLKQISSPLWMCPYRRPEPLRMPKRSRWIRFVTYVL